MFLTLPGPLKYKGFRLFITGHFLSFTGSWIQNTALQWIIYNLHHSTGELGLFNFLTTFPTIFVTLLAGFIIDRFNRKRLLQLLLILALFPPLVLGILLHFGIYLFWAFVILSFLASVLSSIDMPLRQVFISEIVPPQYLTRALSLQASSFNSARMLGPALAGFIMQIFPMSICFFINFISYLPLFIFTFWIKTSEDFSRKSEKFNIIKESKHFLKFLTENLEFSLILLLTASFTFFATSIIILLPMLTFKILQGSAKEFALLSSGVGIGAIMGAFFLFLKKEIPSKIFHLLKAHAFWLTGLLILIFAHTFPIYFISVMLIGFSFTNFYPVVNSFLQERSPSESRGKVMSLFSVAFLGMAPLGQISIGYMVEILNYKVLMMVWIFLIFIINMPILFILKNKEKNV
jgi:MFS family permease